MKLLIIGHGRHGKDTVADMLRDYHGWAFYGSSEWIAYNIMTDYYQKFENQSGDPATLDGYDIFLDRHKNRKEWFDQTLAYNKANGYDSVAKGVLSCGDIYVGMRSRDEFKGSRYLFDAVIWVDQSNGLPKESKDSMGLTMRDADLVIDNNGSLKDLWLLVTDLAEYLSAYKRVHNKYHNRIENNNFDVINTYIHTQRTLNCSADNKETLYEYNPPR